MKNKFFLLAFDLCDGSFFHFDIRAGTVGRNRSRQELAEIRIMSHHNQCFGLSVFAQHVAKLIVLRLWTESVFDVQLTFIPDLVGYQGCCPGGAL